ncbi:MAG: hypothetical protein WBN41_03320 [Lysobacterales bacterium]
MKHSKALNRGFGFALVFSLFISMPVFAGDPLITASFSGIWDQPEQESQGIILQIGEQEDDEKVGIAYWFTYGPDLKTSWYLGVGPVVGNEIEMVLYTASDIGFMAENIEGNEEVVAVGFLDLVFKNCNHGTATYAFDEVNEVIDEGEFPIKRISSIYRQRCSGGISDDTPSGGKPMQMDVSLMPATDDGSGKGKAKFWERTDRSDFMVEAEDIPDGSYTLKICGDNEDPDVEVQMFDMPVVNGEGKLEFRSPEIDEKLNLNFDPRGCKIEILDGDVVVLTSGENVLSEKKTGKPDKDKGDVIKIEADFTSTGVVEGAKGEAEFEMEMDESEFSVKVKDVPVGFYSVEVAGVSKGEVEVVDDDGDLEGRVKFSDPQKAENLLLDFDPRGEIVEIRQTTGDEPAVILEVLFPDE